MTDPNARRWYVTVYYFGAERGCVSDVGLTQRAARRAADAIFPAQKVAAVSVRFDVGGYVRPTPRRRSYR